jgi:cobalt-zinc-cadmium efflux system membrane fusion protein
MTGHRNTALALVLAGAVIAMACSDRTDAAHAPDVEPANEQPRDGAIAVDPVMLSSITVETIADRETATVLAVAGKVQFDEDRVARVLAPLPGQVAGLRVKVGDAVRKGETLCAISSRDAAIAIGDEIESRKDLELAEKNAAMTQDLIRSRGRLENRAAAGTERSRQGARPRRADRRSAAGARSQRA